MDSVANGVEVWKVIPVAPNYEASSLGRIRNIDGLIMRDTVKPCGYRYIRLSIDGNPTSFRVHRLVAMAFHGIPSGDMQVNHRNSDKCDNRPDNLEWVTSSQNIRHNNNYGTRHRLGESNHAARLKEHQVLEIMALKGRMRQKDIGEMYGVSSTTVGFIHRGDKWAWLTRGENV